MALVTDNGNVNGQLQSRASSRVIELALRSAKCGCRFKNAARHRLMLLDLGSPTPHEGCALERNENQIC
jgi:hypothetical protein